MNSLQSQSKTIHKHSEYSATKIANYSIFTVAASVSVFCNQQQEFATTAQLCDIQFMNEIPLNANE